MCTMQCGGKNIRFVVMNNLLPSSVYYHEKYDLKGSTNKRRASRAERAKGSPTLKDLDFIAYHPDGIMLEGDTFAALIKTIERDCRVCALCLYNLVIFVIIILVITIIIVIVFVANDFCQFFECFSLSEHFFWS